MAVGHEDVFFDIWMVNLAYPEVKMTLPKFIRPEVTAWARVSAPKLYTLCCLVHRMSTT